MEKPYHEMSDTEVRSAAQRICSESSSEEEICQRLKNEIGYPYSAAISSHLPTDKVGRQARGIALMLGGTVMKNGAMVMMMLHGPSGKTISV